VKNLIAFSLFCNPLQSNSFFISTESVKMETTNKVATNANTFIQRDREDPGVLREVAAAPFLGLLWLPVVSSTREAISSSTNEALIPNTSTGVGDYN
jgi:hypothetical protein